ncbi:MAG: Holliday junction branch migration protein RuvA [Burkholderiaceae bacterium]
MIGKLSGTVLQKNPPEVLVACQGVGYEVQVSMGTFFTLGELGSTVHLWTHLVVREDAHVLFGFATQEERAAFRELIKVSGVGPRTALSLLSGMSVADLTHAVATQESGRMQKVPGIGKKTAERLLLELRGKLGDALPGAPSTQASGVTADIVQALLALGYNEREASAAVQRLPAEVSVSDGIKQALQALAR